MAADVEGRVLARLIASFTTVCSAALIAARLAVWSFPLQSPIPGDAQSIQARIASAAVMDGAGIEVDPGGLAHLIRTVPAFPDSGVTATGTVVVDASLNSEGEVTDAHVLSGPDELRRSALQSVLQWHYSMDAGATPTVRASITFGAAPAPPTAKKLATPVPSITDVQMVPLKAIEIRGATSAVEQKVRATGCHGEGGRHSHQRGPACAGILEAAKEVDEHFTGGWSMTKDGATVQLTLGCRLSV